jgi:tetratricopeptide (TPR) repeat protein
MPANPADPGSVRGAHTQPRPATVLGPLLRALLLLLAVLWLAPQPVLRPIAALLAAAQAATTAEDYPAAADSLANAAARLPYDAYLNHRAGLSEISAGRFSDAIRHLSLAAEQASWTPARRVALGDAFAGLQDEAAAREQWTLALAETPDDDELLARLANSYEAAALYPQAIATLTELARVRANDSSVYYRLALLTAATQPGEALARLTLAADIAPELEPATRLLIEAVEAGRAAGDEAYTFGRIGYALIQLGEWPLAEVALTEALNRNGEYADAFAYLGLAQDMQDKDGQPNYERALALAPGSPLAQFLMGLHWRRLGDSNNALPYLKTAQSLDPQNPAVAAEIGGAYAALGDLTSAEIWFTEAVRKDEQNPSFWLLLARFYVDHEYHMAELGLPAARMAVGLNPASALAADALGYALVLTGDLVNAEKMLLRALELDSSLASGYYHLGLLYQRQQRPAEAETVLNHALALDPDGTYGGLALKALASLGP